MTDETSPAGQQIPATVGRYQITEALGFGAMGAVYKAFDPLIKRTLAIKTIRLDIPRQSPQYAAFIDRFHREARISGTLSHPNIVTLYDIGEEGGLPFLAMEYVDGCTVASMLEAGTRLKPEKVIALVSQVASALDYAHSRGVVHRDIKPSNLIVSADDKVKVTDFGIAKLADSEITHAGVLLGTPSYMSPEQAMGDKLDGRSDIFSLGVCAFEMLSGQQPFPGANVTAILYKLVHVDPIEPGELEMNGLLPQKWHEVFHKVLAKKPDDRYETAGAFVQELEYCLGAWFTGLGDATVRMSAPGADLSTATLPRVPRPDLPSDAPAVSRAGSGPPASADDVTTVALKPGSLDARPASAPTPAADDPATVLLRPGSVQQDDTSTVVLRAEPQIPAGPPADDVPATILMRAPVFGEAPPSGGEPPPETTAVQAGLPTMPDAQAPRIPGAKPLKPGLPLGWLLGGAAAFTVLAVGVLGWALWNRVRGPEPPPEASLTPAGTPATTVAAAPEPTTSASPIAATGSLQVESVPVGARVQVNGQPRGVTPLELPELPFGSYQVRLEQKGFEPQTQTVSLDAGAPVARVKVKLTRTAALAGSAAIVSTPPGAAVTVDGRSVGRTPLSGLALRPGSHRLALALDGHESWSGVVDVAAGQKGRVEVRLRPEAKPAPTPEPVDPARVYGSDEVDTKPQKVAGNSYPSDRVPRLKSGQRVSVLVQFVVTETGEVRELKVLESAGAAVDEAVLATVRNWKFKPAVKRGTPVKCQTVFRQTFLGG